MKKLLQGDRCTVMYDGAILWQRDYYKAPALWAGDQVVVRWHPTKPMTIVATHPQRGTRDCALLSRGSGGVRDGTGYRPKVKGDDEVYQVPGLAGNG